jgi:hypothetical protein
MNDKEMNDLLRGMRDEPVPMDSVRRVRARVAERTQPGARAWWWIPAVAAALLVGLWLSHGPTERPASTPVMVAEPKRQPQPTLHAVSRPKPEPKPKPVRPVRKREDKILIRIETPDPDVVILLIGD